MVDPGDTVSRTLKKEFGEEAMNSLEATPEEKKRIEKQINELFKEGHTVRKERERERKGGVEVRLREGGERVRERELGGRGRKGGGTLLTATCSLCAGLQRIR